MVSDVDLEESGDPNCPVCREEVAHGQPGICCNQCKTWFHKPCLLMPEETYIELSNSDEDWYCMRCLSIRANKIKWGELDGELSIKTCISATYREVISWRKNIFMLPRGKAGTDFLKELSRLLYLFIDDTKWSRIALSLVHIFLPLMLQKPSRKAKARDNSRFLTERLKHWSEGNVGALLEEGKEIQRRLNIKSR